jgi:coatomer subunit beta'
MSALYSGNVLIWDYAQGTMIKSFEVCTLPVRCAKFISRKQWIVTGSDDMQMRVYNFNTMEKVAAWEAHTDYIRFLEVHPTLPYVLSSSDDMTVKLWDWERGWDCCQVFEGHHAHYVMMVRFNPKDTNTFASASLDRTIKVWGLGASTPHFSLEGHEKGVNCLDYYPGGDKPYLMSGADDQTVRIWDYQTKTCVQTLAGHLGNVSAVLFHPRLPILVSGSEDGTVRLWHATTYRAESTLNYGMERCWSLDVGQDNNKLAIGYDDGTIVLSLGHDMPVASLDTHTGRVVWAVNSEVQTASLKGLAAESGGADGERLPVAPKDLGSTELFPQRLKHNCNGRFLVVCGDGEYIIYTSQALRNKAFGSALEFAWSSVGTGDYAVRETISRIKTFKNFKEQHTLRPPLSSAEGMFGGACLGVKGPDSVVFFDWEDGLMIRKIDVVPNNVYWNETGELVLLACDDVYYVLRYDATAVQSALSQGQVDSEEGVASAFDFLHEVSGKVLMGQWVGDCFIYTNEQQRLVYFVGGEVMTLSHLDRPMHMLGYLPKEDRVFLMDKSRAIVSYRVLQSYLQYQTAVVRKDFETANALLPSIPESEYTQVARFLESQGFKEEALEVSRDPDHRFDLACELGKLDLAKGLLEDIPDADMGTLDAQTKWKRVGDLALANADLGLFKESARRAVDLPGLLLLYSSTGDAAGMDSLAEEAEAAGKANVAFLASLLRGKLDKCVSLLVEAGRLPEAAFFARTYLPSAVPDLVAQWRAQLKSSSGSKQVSEKLAEAIADPENFPDLFPDVDVALKVEAVWRQQAGKLVPAHVWPQAQEDLSLDLIELFKQAGEGGPMKAVADLPPPAPAAVAKTPEVPAEQDVMPVLQLEEEEDFVSIGNEGQEEEEAEAQKRRMDAQLLEKEQAAAAAAAASLAAQERAAKEAAQAQEQASRQAAEMQARKAAEEQEAVAAQEQAAREAAAAAAARKLAEDQAARQAAEEQARKFAEEQARKQAEEQARKLAEEQARKLAEEQARKQAEEQAAAAAAEAQRIAEVQARESREAQERAEKEARERAEAAKARAEQEAKARAEAAKAKAIAAAQARAESARKAAEDAARAKAEQEAKEKAEAEAAAAAAGAEEDEIGSDFGEDW